MTGGWESVVYQIGKCAFKVENGEPFVLHLRNLLTDNPFFFDRQEKIFRVRVRRVKIKRHRFDILRLFCNQAHLPHGVFVDLVDGHIKAKVLRIGIFDIRHYGVVCVASYGIMSLFVTIEADQNQIRFRQIDWKSPVRDQIYNHKPHFLGLHHQIPDCQIAVIPQERLSTIEEQDSHAQIIQCLHIFFNLGVRVHDFRDIVVYCLNVSRTC